MKCKWEIPVLFCCVLSLICPLTGISQEKAEGCTIGVASGKATADGRPLLWKNADGGGDREVVYFKDGRFKYLAVAAAGDSRWVNAGVNEFGFCIISSLAFDLPDKSKKGMGGVGLMKLSLQKCLTVDDFESILKQTNISGRTTACNIGVIDAFGGAAIFETGNLSYTRFDANDPKVAPQGYIVRANFTFTGGGNQGRPRYDRANQLWQQVIEKDQLDYRYVLRKVCRDLSGAEKISYTPPETEVTEDNNIEVLNTKNAISNSGTMCVALFHGVRLDENPSLTTFWTIMGEPIFSIAVPSWVIAESTAPEMNGEERSPLYTAARVMHQANYLMGNRRRPLLNPNMLPDIWVLNYPTEDRIFDRTESILSQWRQNYPTARQVACFHQYMASEAMDTLEEVNELLVQKGATTSKLHIALYTRDLETAKALIRGGIDINALDGYGYAPLRYAIQNDQKEIVELLISKNADVNSKDRRGCTPLYYAIWKEDKDIVELLVTKGANVNFTLNGDYPPLHYAVWNEDKEMVELFVNNGAKFDVKDQDGWTAFRYAAAQGNRDIVEFFITKGANVSSFHMAACLGNLARVRRFCDEGADVDAKDELSWTPLGWAVCTGQKEVAEFLITRDANIHTESNDGTTILHQAAGSGAKELAELLISKGADVNAKAKDGNTPLYSAASRGHREVVKLLIAKGASIDARGRNNWTPLHIAARRGHRDAVEILLFKGADVNTKDDLGLTPLWWAKNRGDTESAELLKKHGAKE